MQLSGFNAEQILQRQALSLCEQVNSPNVNALSQLHVFEKLYRSGYQSNLLERTLSKLVVLETQHIQSELAQINSHLAMFENQYQMASEIFYQRYESGELEDSADFTEWASFYDMQQLLKQQLLCFDRTSQ